MKYTVAAIICVFLSSLGIFNGKAENITTSDVGRLRFDGFYNTYDTSFQFTYPEKKHSFADSTAAFLNRLLSIKSNNFPKQIENKRLNEVAQAIDVLIFIDNNLVFYNKNRSSKGMPDFRCAFNVADAKEVIGNIKIIGDSIYASIPTRFMKTGYSEKRYLTHYNGYIKNKDTILNWHVIPPYPKIRHRFNEFHKDTAPKMLYFVKYDRVSELDEILTD